MNRFFLEAAVANNGGAMEAETISKNGRSSKSQMNRGNMVLIKPFGLIATVVIMFAMVACGGGGNIIMKTASSSNVSFTMSGSGNITIDWGDGEREKHELGDRSNFSHKYSGASVRTVTITGKNITHLYCSGQYYQLTNLDVSKNTALTYLHCGVNQLTSTAINALFGTLHSNNIDGKRIIYVGSDCKDCDKTIATNKGWEVN